MKILVFLGSLAVLFQPVLIKAANPYQFINDFECSVPGDWFWTAYRNVIVDDSGIVTTFAIQQFPHAVNNQNPQTLFRRFDQFGNPLSEPIFISDSSQYQTRGNWHIGSNGSGRWACANKVLLHCENWPFCVEELRGWVSNASGGSLYTEFPVGGEFADTWRQDNPSAAMDTAGNFVIVFARGSGGDSLYQDAWCRLYDPQGVPRSDYIPVNDMYMPDGTFIGSGSVRIAMNSSGEFVIVWQGWCGPTCQFPNTNPVAFMRLFNANGVPKTDEMYVADPRTELPRNCLYPSVAIADNGNFAVAWTRLNDPCDAEINGLICLKRFFADGTPMEPERILDTVWCSPNVTPTAQISSDTAFNLLVSWENNNGDYFTNYGNLYACKVNAKGDQVGPNYRINDRELMVIMHTTASSMNSEGLCAFFWGEESLPGSGPDTRDMLQLMDYDDVGNYICGDADNNHFVTISDAVYLIQYIFAGGQKPVVPYLGDADGNGIVTISDVVYLINYIFGGGPAPCEL